MIDSDYRSQRNEKEWWLVTFHLHVLEIGLWWPSFCCLNLLQKSRNVVIIWRPICVFWICISGSISLVIILIFMASWKFALQYIFNKAQQLKRKIQGFQWPCQTIQWDWDNNFTILYLNIFGTIQKDSKKAVMVSSMIHQEASMHCLIV